MTAKNVCTAVEPTSLTDFAHTEILVSTALEGRGGGKSLRIPSVCSKIHHPLKFLN